MFLLKFTFKFVFFCLLQNLRMESFDMADIDVILIVSLFNICMNVLCKFYFLWVVALAWGIHKTLLICFSSKWSVLSLYSIIRDTEFLQL